MMTEYKFRAWDIENNWMLSWEEIQEEWESEGYYDSIFRQDHYITEQYTGINDTNGKEIYNGDILEIQDKDKKFLSKVIYLEDDLSYYYFISRKTVVRLSVLPEYNYKTYNVVDNIHNKTSKRFKFEIEKEETNE